MRVAAAAALAATGVALAGCGSSSADKAGPTARHGDSSSVVVKPVASAGHWVKLVLSPDTKTWLGQWSGECEVQTAYFVPAHGGKARSVTGHASDESLVLGWSAGNRARILVPRAACGSQFRTPGIYLVDRQGRAALVKKVTGRRGGA